jgi:hypothetical protein
MRSPGNPAPTPDVCALYVELRIAQNSAGLPQRTRNGHVPRGVPIDQAEKTPCLGEFLRDAGYLRHKAWEIVESDSMNYVKVD